MSSLGFRPSVVNDRPGRPVAPLEVLPEPSVATGRKLACRMMVPKGLLPTLFYSLFFLAVPLVWLYQPGDIADGSATSTRVLAIAGAAVGGLFLIAANDCVAWFNMSLFFHIGIEVKVLELLLAYAQADAASTLEMVLGWIAFVVVIVHLIPFLLTDRLGLLTLLAYAGVVVNAAAMVYVSYADLLLVSLSSGMLLGSTILIAGIDCLNTSLLSTLRKATRDGTWIVCLPFEA